MDQFKEQCEERKKRNDDMMQKIAELEMHIGQVEKSLFKKKRHVLKRKEMEKDYVELIAEQKRTMKKRRISTDKKDLPELEPIRDKLEQLIEHQYASKTSVTSDQLTAIRPLLENVSSNADYFKQVNKFIKESSLKLKNENMQQQQKDDSDKEYADKRAIYKQVKKKYAERVMESRRLFLAKKKLERETREEEIKLSERIKELYKDPKIQGAYIKSLRLKAACRQVRTEVQLTREQVRTLQQQIQELETNKITRRQSISVEELFDTIAEKQKITRSLIATNDATRMKLREEMQRQKRKLRTQ
ncbi:hypothetical protein BCV72DRAFT_64813 [Rhizopus microsporus var. microsporus]|nr:hypothetical protein BCV72DRAFT_64813 [Rhizopus microsporus var. microsporus]